MYLAYKSTSSTHADLNHKPVNPCIPNPKIVFRSCLEWLILPNSPYIDKFVKT